MSMEELRFFFQIPDIISLEFLDGPAVSTVGEADSAIYFTREQFIIGEAVSTCLSGTSCAYSSEHYSDFDGLYAKPSLPVGYLTGGDLFRLYTEARD